MIAKIQRWAGNLGFRFRKAFLREGRIQVAEVGDGKIVIEPMVRVHGKYDVRDLVAQIPEDCAAEEIEWGEPQGKEAW